MSFAAAKKELMMRNDLQYLTRYFTLVPVIYYTTATYNYRKVRSVKRSTLLSIILTTSRELHLRR